MEEGRPAKAPIIPWYSLAWLAGKEELKFLMFMSAGGLSQRDGAVNSAGLWLNAPGAPDVSFVAPHSARIKMIPTQFRDDLCIFVGQTSISRREMIKYVRNELGGGHPPGVSPKPQHEAFRKLETMRVNPVTKLDPLTHEVLSACQALLESRAGDAGGAR